VRWRLPGDKAMDAGAANRPDRLSASVERMATALGSRKSCNRACRPAGSSRAEEVRSRHRAITPSAGTPNAAN
jgi:hypothetical protein